jgi:hypothetical protein
MKSAVLIIATLVVSVMARSEKKQPRIPVMISVKHIENGEIYFQPMIAPMFEGLLTGETKGKISKCYATQEPVAELKDGGVVTNLVLECEGAKITVKGVDFQ